MAVNLGYVTTATMVTFFVLLCTLGANHGPKLIVLPTFGVFLGGIGLWYLQRAT